MNAITKEWIRKAEEDYRVCRRELAVRRGASLDAVCFHAQQCAEKYVKAVLQESGLAFPKTHDLDALINRLLPTYPKFIACLPACNVLASHAVEVRYPGLWATRSDAKTAFSDRTRHSKSGTKDPLPASSTRSQKKSTSRTLNEVASRHNKVAVRLFHFRADGAGPTFLLEVLKL